MTKKRKLVISDDEEEEKKICERCLLTIKDGGYICCEGTGKYFDVGCAER